MEALAKKIVDQKPKEGLAIVKEYQIVPMAFGIKVLKMSMIFENEKISPEVELESWLEKFPEIRRTEITQFENY